MTRLALVMIAKDEARAIARALASARPHVDKLIVLDTGSTDATRQIASDARAEVHSFAWCDDFAAARNAALALSDLQAYEEHARGDPNLPLIRGYIEALRRRFSLGG